MRRRAGVARAALLALLLAVLLAVPAPALLAADAAAVFERAAPSVFSVLAQQGGDGSEALSQGSGVVVGPGLIATNHHVVADAREILVRQGSWQQAATVERSDPASDLALLRVEALEAPAAAFGSAVRIGQTVYAVGSPRGLELSLSAGIVSSMRRFGEVAIIQTTAPISPGSSGGGLFDEQGRLVGLTTAQAAEGQNLNFAIPVDQLAKLGVLVPVEAADRGPGALAEPTADPSTAPAPAASPAPSANGASPAPAAQPATADPAAAALKARARRAIFITSLVIALLLLLAKPAARWLTEALARSGSSAGTTLRAPPKVAAVDRLAPYRQLARSELAQTRDETTWRAALEQAGGQEAGALSAYVELRAQRLYRAELDRKWAEAQAGGTGPLPPPR